MPNDTVAHHLRRAWHWSVVGALLATLVPILEFIARAPAWASLLTTGCAGVAWINLIIQTRLLRSVSGSPRS